MTWAILSSDEQASLVERIREGSREAEEKFVNLFSERIRVLALVRTRDAEAARELTQDVMFTSWRAIREGQLRNPERLAAFVHGIARNVVNSYLRDRSARPTLQPLAEVAENISAPEDAESTERRRLVSAALHRLGPDDRQVLLLTLVRGLKPREIAATLGLSEEVVRTRKSRALKRIIDAVAALSRNIGKGH